MKTSRPNYFYTSDGIRIFYLANFDKKTLKQDIPLIVFNYGLMCNIAHFAPQMEFFDSLGYQVLGHDYRGHYNSTSLNGVKDCTFSNITNDLQQLLTHLSVKKCIMLGHSMGVNITLEFATRFPKFIKQMVLISGTVFPPQDVMFDSNAVEVITPFIEWATEEYPEQFEYIWKSTFKNPIARYLIKDGGFNKEKVNDEFIQIYMKKISELPKEIFLHLMNEMKIHSVINNLETIHIPTLIMGGDQDKVIPHYLQKILHDKIKGSQYYILKNGSHVPQIDFPEFTNQRIQLFLEQE